MQQKVYEVAIEVVNIIEEKGYQAYVVGGLVRDFYLQKQLFDIDICTSATPKEIKAILINCNISKEQYGCVTVNYKGIKLEITTFRKESEYINKRKPIKVEYITSLEEDLKRRDFTMNTLCIDKFGNVIDLLNGKKDIDEKKIRCVNDCDKKISVDALRILRAIRFATILDFKLSKTLEDSIKKYKQNVKALSIFRKKEELDKILISPNRGYGINLLIDFELDNILEIELKNIVITDSPICFWAQQEKDFGFTKIEKDLILKIKQALKLDLLNNNTLYKYGLYICQLASEIKQIDKKIITTKYIELPIKHKEDIVVNISDICRELNIKPKQAKIIFHNIENEIINNRLKNNVEEINLYVRRCI